MTLERSAIVEAIRAANGNLTDAAKALGASRRTLQNRMREYGMPRGKSGRRKRHLPYGRRSRWLAGAGAVAAVVVGVTLFARHRV